MGPVLRNRSAVQHLQCVIPETRAADLSTTSYSVLPRMITWGHREPWERLGHQGPWERLGHQGLQER